MACSTAQKDRSLERPERWIHHFLKTNGIFYFAERQDVSVQRPERWKRHFLKTNGMFYFVERQDVSVQRPERWKRHFLKTNGMFYLAGRQEPRAPRKMETPLSEDQWHVLLCRMTQALSETPTFGLRIGCPTFGRRVLFVRSLTRKHHFRLGTKGRCDFRLCRMTEALSETPAFDFRVGFSIFGRRVFL